MINHIYPSELQLNKANSSDTEAPFLDLHLNISDGFISSKIHDKRDDFDFDIKFPFLDGDVPSLHLTGFIYSERFFIIEYLYYYFDLVKMKYLICFPSSEKIIHASDSTMELSVCPLKQGFRIFSQIFR